MKTKPYPKPKKMFTTSPLVVNMAKTPAADVPSAGRITINASTSLVRNETLEGVEYKVVPMVMLVEGVVPGSDGALFYPGEELKKLPGVWNMKPVCVYHPKEGDNFVSACTPDQVEKSKVGLIMNCVYDSLNRLKAEAWIDPIKADKVDIRVNQCIDAGKMMELSTGLFPDLDMTAGEFEGEAYKGIVRNMRPDHLAILPDKTGACSIAKGAGLLRNEKDGGVTSHPARFDAAVRRVLSEFTVNEQSFEQIRQQLQGLLEGNYPKDTTSNYCSSYPWICEVFPGYFVYEYQGVYFKQEYSQMGDTVNLSGSAMEVVRKVTYVAKTVPTTNQHTPQVHTMKNKLVAMLIANHGWSEADRPKLEKMAEATLKDLVVNEGGSLPAVEVKAASSLDELLANGQVTPELHATLTANAKRDKDAHTAAVNGLIANKANKLSKEQLERMDILTLNSLAESLTPAAAPVANEEDDDVEDKGAAPAGEPVVNEGAAGKQERVLVAPKSF